MTLGSFWTQPIGLGLLLNFAEACPKITKYSQALGRDRAAADLMRPTGFEEHLSQQHSDRTELRPVQLERRERSRDSSDERIRGMEEEKGKKRIYGGR